MRNRKDRQVAWEVIDREGLYIPGKVLIAPKAILPEGYILPSTAPIPENPQARIEMPEALEEAYT